MAILKKFTGIKNSDAYHCGSDNTGLVINPNNDTLWINSIPHDHDTLYPLFDKPCSTFKSNILQSSESHSFTRTQIISKAPCLQNGQDSSDSHGQQYSAYSMLERDCNLEDNMTLSSSSRLFHFNSSSNKDFYLYLVRSDNASYENAPNYYFIEGNDFSNPDSVTYGQFSNNPTGSMYGGGSYSPVHVDTSNKIIYFVHRYSPSSSNTYNRQTHGRMVGIVKSSYTTVEDDGSLSIGTPEAVLTSVNMGFGVSDYLEPNNFYYCGKNNDNSLMFFEFSEMYNSQDPRYYIANQVSLGRSDALLVAESVDPSSGTVSSIASLTTANLTDSSAAVVKMLRPRPTACINSPISGEDNIYYSYYPVCDTNNNVSFTVITWDKSANSNAGSVSIDNCTMSYGSGETVTDFLTYPSFDANNVSTIASNSFITIENGNYYLHYLPHYGTPTCLAAQSSTAKNLVTYQIDSTDFSDLTYHSSTQINALNFVHLTSDRKKIAVISSGEITVLQWNNGWTETASETGNFTGVTQDSNGRILAISSSHSDTSTASSIPENSNFAYIEQKIHLISDSLPSTVTINFADASLTYSGSNITTSVNVSAYNSSSVRIAKSVDLKIDGANAQFTSNSSTAITVNSLTSGELSVPITVTGPGPISISAAFSL